MPAKATWLLVVLLGRYSAEASVIWSQQPTASPGATIASQLWFDPTGQNNLDSDAAAYDAFTLNSPAIITRVEWWGDGAASVGFFITFYGQDTNTLAYQPDLPEFHGHPALASEESTNYTQIATGSGLYHYVANLVTPVKLEANTALKPRYFLSIVDSMPLAYYTWGWSYGTGGDGKLFYFQLAGSLAGGPYYTLRTGDLAFVLSDATPQLEIVPIDINAMMISWPTNSAGYFLEESADLSRTNWIGSTNPVVLAGDHYQVQAVSAPGARFYRLRQP